MNNLDIRQSKADDLQLILEWTILLHQHEDDGALKMHSDFKKNLEQWLKLELDNPNSLVLIGEVDRKPVGFIAATSILNDNGFLETPMKGLINLLWVDTKYRQNKIAQKLLSEIEQCLSSIGIKCIECNYTSNNLLAKTFWDKNGYQQCSVTARKILNT